MWAFPRGEIILGVLEMPGTPQKRKWTANHQISPEIGKNCQKTNEPHTFPTHSHYGQREFFGRKWREYGRNRGADAKLGKPLEESQVVFFSGLSPGEKLFWRYWRCLAPLKNKRGQLLQSQNKSRNWQKKINQWQPNILLFPLIPTKARTTKLAQKLEKHPKPIKTMFNQWVAERTFV